MTKLEEEIFMALGDSIDTMNDDCTDEYSVYAKAAAEVAKKWMEKAWEGAIQRRVYKGDVYTITFEEWLKENGITE